MRLAQETIHLLKVQDKSFCKRPLNPFTLTKLTNSIGKKDLAPHGQLIAISLPSLSEKDAPQLTVAHLKKES